MKQYNFNLLKLKDLIGYEKLMKYICENYEPKKEHIEILGNRDTIIRFIGDVLLDYRENKFDISGKYELSELTYNNLLGELCIINIIDDKSRMLNKAIIAIDGEQDLTYEQKEIIDTEYILNTVLSKNRNSSLKYICLKNKIPELKALIYAYENICIKEIVNYIVAHIKNRVNVDDVLNICLCYMCKDKGIYIKDIRNSYDVSCNDLYFIIDSLYIGRKNYVNIHDHYIRALR